MKTIKLEGSYTAEELKQKIAELEKPSDWRDRLVDVSEKHYYLTDSNRSNEIVIMHSAPCNYSEPIKSFHTLAQAQLVADKVNLLIEMENWAYANNFNDDGSLWIADWGNGNQNKFGFEYFNNKFSVVSRNIANLFPFGISVKDEETAERMFEYFKDRLSVYNKQIQ